MNADDFERMGRGRILDGVNETSSPSLTLSVFDDLGVDDDFVGCAGTHRCGHASGPPVRVFGRSLSSSGVIDAHDIIIVRAGSLMVVERGPREQTRQRRNRLRAGRERASSMDQARGRLVCRWRGRTCTSATPAAWPMACVMVYWSESIAMLDADDQRDGRGDGQRAKGGT